MRPRKGRQALTSWQQGLSDFGRIPDTRAVIYFCDLDLLLMVVFNKLVEAAGSVERRGIETADEGFGGRRA